MLDWRIKEFKQVFLAGRTCKPGYSPCAIKLNLKGRGQQNASVAVSNSCLFNSLIKGHTVYTYVPAYVLEVQANTAIT